MSIILKDGRWLSSEHNHKFHSMRLFSVVSNYRPAGDTGRSECLGSFLYPPHLSQLQGSRRVIDNLHEPSLETCLPSRRNRRDHSVERASRKTHSTWCSHLAEYGTDFEVLRVANDLSIKSRKNLAGFEASCRVAILHEKHRLQLMYRYSNEHTPKRQANLRELERIAYNIPGTRAMVVENVSPLKSRPFE